MSTFLSVKNNGTEPFSAKFDGQTYLFESNKPLTITVEAAQHIFGLGVPDKSEVMSRHGWFSHSAEKDSALAKLNAFSFSTPDDNQDSEPVVEFPSTPEPVDNEQGSAPLQSEADTEAEVPDGAEAEVSATVSPTPAGDSVKGGSILDNVASFLSIKA